MKLFLAVVVVACSALPTNAEPYASGFALCSVIDATGLGSKPCEVGDKSLTVTFDIGSAEARKTCPKMSALAKKWHLSFDPGWWLNIASPYSDGESIASCPLPR